MGARFTGWSRGRPAGFGRKPCQPRRVAKKSSHTKFVPGVVKVVKNETAMISAANSWNECFERLAPRLVLYARQITGSLEDAEDVVQMAFVRWWRRYPDGDESQVPLLYAAVRTIALDLRRGDQRRQNREQAVTTEAPVFFDTVLEDKERGALVSEALRELSPVQQEVVTLKIWGGLTFAEIAGMLGESINTITSRYRYALGSMEKRLAPLREDLLSPPATAMPAYPKTEPEMLS